MQSSNTAPARHEPRLIRISSPHPTHAMLASLDLPSSSAAVILNGSTSPQQAAHYKKVQSMLQDGLARWLVERNASAITGATDAGIFSVLGRGLARWGKPAACIGVTVADLVRIPGTSKGQVNLEPNHSHVVLVPGERWGDETETMYALAEIYAPAHRSIAIYVGGGPITLNEMEANARTGRPILLIAGSGGVVDSVFAAGDNSSGQDTRYVAIQRTGIIHAVPMTITPTQLRSLLDTLLG